MDCPGRGRSDGPRLGRPRIWTVVRSYGPKFGPPDGPKFGGPRFGPQDGQKSGRPKTWEVGRYEILPALLCWGRGLTHARMRRCRDGCRSAPFFGKGIACEETNWLWGRLASWPLGAIRRRALIPKRFKSHERRGRTRTRKFFSAAGLQARMSRAVQLKHCHEADA